MTHPPTPWNADWSTGQAMRFLHRLRGRPGARHCWPQDLEMALLDAEHTGVALPITAAISPIRRHTGPLGEVLVFADTSALALRRARTHLLLPAQAWVHPTWDAPARAHTLHEGWRAMAHTPSDPTSPPTWDERHMPFDPKSMQIPSFQARVDAAIAARHLLLDTLPAPDTFWWERRPLHFWRTTPNRLARVDLTYPTARPAYDTAAGRRWRRLARAVSFLFPGRMGWATAWEEEAGNIRIAPAPFLHLPDLPNLHATPTAHTTLAWTHAIHAIAPRALHALGA